jgi:hypothetical protein
MDRLEPRDHDQETESRRDPMASDEFGRDVEREFSRIEAGDVLGRAAPRSYQDPEEPSVPSATDAGLKSS